MSFARIVVAPDKFKGSLTASEAASAIERGLQSVPQLHARITRIPMADGGEGTVDVFVAAGARAEERTVRGPLGEPVRATFAFDETGLAVVEMAAASGLLLLDRERYDPLRTSTHGTGELVRAALERGARHIVLGIGGSATNDGGAGFLSAVGVRFLDASGDALEPGGAALERLATVDLSGLDPRLRDVELEVACDVDNVLAGEHGATYVFGPQKGASPTDVARLDAALSHFADVTAAVVGHDDRNVAGAGAAGGLGYGLVAYLGVRLRPGVDIVAEAKDLRAALGEADLCLTGEGRIDEQTLRGKTVVGVARIARECGVPVVAFAGSVDPMVARALAESGIACAVPIVDAPMTLARAFDEAGALLERAAQRLGTLLILAETANVRAP